MLLTVDSNENQIITTPIPQLILNPKNLENKILSGDPFIHQHVANISQFLLADLAEWRQDLPTAKKHFSELLNQTQDPRIAAILTELAIGSEDYLLTSTSAAAWANLEPKNLNAQLIAIIMLIGEDQTLTEKFLAQAINYNPDKLYHQLPAVISQLTDAQKILLAEQINNLIAKDKQDPFKYLTLAQIKIYQNDITAATNAVKIALKLQANLTAAILLQAKLIKHNTQSDVKALNYLEQQLNTFPKNNALRIFYANALFDNNQNIAALSTLSTLINNNQTFYPDAFLLAAEIHMQSPNGNLTKAKKYLTKILDHNENCDKAYFLLGTIAEQQSDLIQAIKYYTLIENNPFQIIGLFRSALLLAQNNELSLALEVLNQVQAETTLEKKQLILLKIELTLELKDLQLALENVNEGLTFLSEDPDFLYTSSVAYIFANKINLAEHSLKKLIKIQPKNHLALNNLGFILTENPNNYQEALTYLQQAVHLDPQNPAYLDNLGELLFKMGKISEALHILTNAYTLEPNIPIAIHLGEVLWASGQKQQAKTLWKTAWKSDPNNLELLKVLNSHQVFFAKIK